MQFDFGVKEVLDWTVPVVFAWVGDGIRRHLKAMQRQMVEAKDSVVALNLQIAKLLERVEAHGRELDSHEKRIRHVEQTVPRKRQ